MSLFPTQFEFYEYSAFGKIFFVLAGTTGALVSVGLGRLKHWEKVIYVSSATLFIAAAITHALTLWILNVDLMRSTGNIPLPMPFAAAAYVCALFLDLVGPILAGLVMGYGLRIIHQWHRHRLVPVCCLVAFYAMWVAPWAGTIIFD